MTSKTRFKDSYEMRLVNEFKLSILYFALSHEDVSGPTGLTRWLGSLLRKIGKCFF